MPVVVEIWGFARLPATSPISTWLLPLQYRYIAKPYYNLDLSTRRLVVMGRRWSFIMLWHSCRTWRDRWEEGIPYRCVINPRRSNFHLCSGPRAHPMPSAKLIAYVSVMLPRETVPEALIRARLSMLYRSIGKIV